jgi:putative selenate reductase
MRGLGVRNVPDYVAKTRGQGEDATARAVARAREDPRYRSEALRPPRRIGRHLALFDCINCDKCLPACPNDANFVYEAEPLAREYESYRVEGGRAVPVAGGRFEARERHQIANFQDFCNDCGNCDTFCPEDGGPYLEKPRFFGSLAAWREQGARDGFFVERRSGRDVMWGRLRGVEYRLEVDRAVDEALFTDGRVTLELRHRERHSLGLSVAPDTLEGHTLDVGAYLTMAVLLDGVLDPRRANPVNATVAAP